MTGRRQADRTVLLTNGHIVTMRDGAQANAECDAMLVRGGRIVAVGKSQELAATAKQAHRVDLRGATLMPGLIDTHPHLMHFFARTNGFVNLADAPTHDAVAARIRAKAAMTPPGEWVMATPIGEPWYFVRRSWRDLAEGTMPDRRVLDSATARHPVIIQAWTPVMPNVCALNSLALSVLGIDRSTPPRIGNVWIDKDQHGEPTGILRGAVNTVYNPDPFARELFRKLPRPQSRSDLFDGVRMGQRFYNSLGVTTVYEGHNVTPDQIDVFREFRRADALSVRVLAAPQAEISSALTPWMSPLTLEQFEGNLEQALRLVESHDDWLKVDGVTLNVAGPFWSGMLMMREPYLGPFGDPTTGERNIAIEKQRLAVQFCAERGLRFNMIQGGTAGHDESLDIYESVAAQSPALRRNIQDGNWVLQHGYPIEPDQIRRFADLGFDFTISMSFPWGKGDVFRERAGPEILKHLNPLRTVIDAGISVGAGSDWGPKNIFEHFELAMTHRFCGSGYRNLGPAQTITREEAVAMWTRDAAKVLRWPGIGVLEPGAHADFIVVDRNPLSCAVEDLAGTGVLLTVVGGRAVYDTRAIAYGDWPHANRPSSPLSARGKWGLYDGCC